MIDIYEGVTMKHRATKQNNPLYLVVIAYLLACGLALFILASMSPDFEAAPAPAPAPKVKTEKWVEPYGGCDEAYLYPKSRGYRECVAHGFIEEK